MLKQILLISSFLLLNACSTKDELYYKTHPETLRKAIKQCSEASSTEQECIQLRNIAADLNRLGYELQLNPQAFGKKIIALQEDIAAQEFQEKSQPELKELIIKNKQQLEEYLAVVKWLESP